MIRACLFSNIEYGVDELNDRIDNSLIFPTVESATSTSRVHLSREQSQVLTGHSHLNVYQHRFKFRDSPIVCVW